MERPQSPMQELDSPHAPLANPHLATLMHWMISCFEQLPQISQQAWVMEVSEPDRAMNSLLPLDRPYSHDVARPRLSIPFPAVP